MTKTTTTTTTNAIPARRNILKAALLGPGAIGLRALATGLPASFLLDPVRTARAATAAITAPQYLILSLSASGDALNCNVPGTYDLPASFAAGSVYHPETPEMMPKALKLNGASYTAASPWANLPQNLLDRTVFFHHRTQTANHGEMERVLALFGVSRRGVEAPSFFSAQLATAFGTVQPQPIALGGETVSFNGRYLPKLSPTGLKAVLASPTDLARDLQNLRDGSLDALNKLFKENRASTKPERNFLDQLALSQNQFRKVADQVSTDLAAITADNGPNQVLAAALLVKLNVTPVVTIHLPFSGDNHLDTNWQNETTQTVASAANIKLLFDKLTAYGMQDKVSFAALNVFGRTFDGVGSGRGHNPSHNVALMIGKPFRGGVVGGLLPGGVSSDLDAATGRAMPGGDVAAADSLPAVAKTLGVGIGLPQIVVDDQITGGKIVRAALA